MLLTLSIVYATACTLLAPSETLGSLETCRSRSMHSPSWNARLTFMRDQQSPPRRSVAGDILPDPSSCGSSRLVGRLGRGCADVTISPRSARAWCAQTGAHVGSCARRMDAPVASVMGKSGLGNKLLILLAFGSWSEHGTSQVPRGRTHRRYWGKPNRGLPSPSCGTVLKEVRRDDRSSLARDRRLLPA